MKLLRIIVFLLVYLISNSIEQSVDSENGETELNALVITLSSGSETFRYYVDSFNKYAKENDLNVKINLEQITDQNSTYSLYNAGYMIETLLKKKRSKYDMFFYDNTYSDQYEPYLLDLKDLLPKDHIAMYNPEVLSLIAYKNGRLISMPATIDFTGLFSNKALLDKYKRPIPKTWEELIETSKIVLEGEKAYNNTNLIAYNGLYDYDNGIYSLLEFIYSCRDEVDSPFPEFTSDTTIRAAKLIKRIKEEIASDGTFQSTFNVAVGSLMQNTGLFIKFYYVPGLLHPFSPYEVSSMPGIKEGISGTVLVGYNIGILGNIEKSKIMPAVEAIKFFTSKEMQIDLVLKEYIISGISTLYEDEEICSKIRFCDFYRYPQAITAAQTLPNLYNSNEYYDRYVSLFYEYLYGNEKVEDVLKRMDDIAKIYHFSVSTKDSNAGLTVFIILICFMTFIVLSLSILHTKRFRNEFVNFLRIPDWYMLIIGIVLVLCSSFTKYEVLSAFKCHLNCFLLSLGFTFIYLPFLFKLIITFPEDNNKYSKWVYKNKYLFYLFFIIVDVVLNAFTAITPYKIKTIYFTKGENYEVCDKQNNTILNLFIYLIVGYKFTFSLVMLLLCFIEWNIVRIKMDVKFILTSVYLNIMTVALLLIFSSFEINNYVSYYMIQEIFILLISLANYVALFFLRTLIPVFNQEDENALLFEHFKTTTKTNDKSVISNAKSSNTGNSSRSTSLFSKILDYHKKEYTSNDINVISSRFDTTDISASYGTSNN